MQPLASGKASLPLAERDHLGADALPSRGSRNEGVDDERVGRAVPCHIREPDEVTVSVRAYPSQAVTFDLPSPVIAHIGMVEGLGMESIHLVVVERAAPGVLDLHRRTVTGVDRVGGAA